MKLKLEDMIAKHNACVNAIDENKNCHTCKYLRIDIEKDPCESCYDTILGFPVNPTKWESK